MNVPFNRKLFIYMLKDFLIPSSDHHVQFHIQIRLWSVETHRLKAALCLMHTRAAR